ncbi:MAG: InlB B-repeat-containing protein [Clostridia bacterium]|nr:InlB B-repeat-containing protein [Clostridia bacterium]
MGYKFKRKRKIFKTYHIFLILIIFLIAISTTYALYTTQLIINGTATGVQEQFSIIYANMENSSSYPSTIGYMDTYLYTFAIPPVIKSITMGEMQLVANTDYTYTNGTLTIQNVTGNLVIQGDDDAQNVNVTFDVDENIVDVVTVIQGNTISIPDIAPEKQGYGFLGWADSNDVLFDFSTPIMTDITLHAKWQQGAVAEINGTFYTSLQDAIDAVPTTNTETKVKLLQNVSENLVVAQNKNINFDFQNFTISITTGTLLENSGTVKISNGILTSSSTQTATINNQSTGNITISGGRILMTATGGKQALYNDQGTVVITGTAYLSSASSNGNNKRATVQNLASSTLTISGGSIVSQSFIGVNNAGTMTIGTEDGTSDKTSPIIQAATIGVSCSTDFEFYDGTIKGKSQTVNDEAKITDKETGYSFIHSSEEIDGETYHTLYLAIKRRVTFDANYGSVSEPTRDVETGTKIGTLPIPSRTNYVFDGWFTLAEGGEEITENTIINNDITYYAHWITTAVADVNGTGYYSLADAINAAPNNTETTIKLLANISESVTIAANKNIIFNMQNYSISGTNKQVIVNKGTLRIYNGQINQTKTEAAINNENNAHLYITGGTINSTGGKAAIYNLGGGTVEISGSANLISNASGSRDNMYRGTVQNLANGTIVITGGTIEGTNGFAVSNYGTLTLGVKSDGNINISSPEIIGKKTYGLNNAGTFNYYDGIIKGITDAITGLIDDQEPNTGLHNGTEQIDGQTYKTVYLEETP